MAATYTYYKDTARPTATDIAVRSNFLAHNDINLILVKSSILDILSLVPTHVTSNDPPLQRRLQFKAFGNIEAVQSVRLPGRSRDSLLLAFADARLSVIDYDPARNNVVTTSLHTYDDLRLENADKINRAVLPILRVDPSNRCAAMLAFGTTLIVFPIIRRDAVGELRMKVEKGDLSDVKETKGLGGSPHLPWVLDLAGTLKITNVRDFCFMDCYTEPTLLILHDEHFTNSGRYSVARNTSRLSSVSINLTSQTGALITCQDKLPHAISRVVPIPAPIGGALVLSPNVIFHFNTLIVDHVLSLNDHGAKERGFVTRHSAVVTVLDNPQWSFLSPTRLLLGTQLGDQFLVSLVMQGKDVHALEMTIAGYGPSPSAMCTLSYDHVFIASRLGHSLLLQYHQKESSDDTSTPSLAAPPPVLAIEGPPAAAAAAHSESKAVAASPTASSLSSSITAAAGAGMKDEPSSSPPADGWGLGDDIEDEDGLFTTSEGPLAKRQRMYTPGVISLGVEKKSDSDNEDDDEEDEPEPEPVNITEDELERAMYGQSEPSSSLAAARRKKKKKERPAGPSSSYVFMVRDKLVNFAPVGDFTMGQAPKQGDVEEDAEDALEVQAQQAAAAALHGGETKEIKYGNGNGASSSSGSNKDEPRVKVLDIITCSGYGRDGCLAVINGGVVPDVIHHTALPKRSIGSWTVRHRMAVKVKKSKKAAKSTATNNDDGPPPLMDITGEHKGEAADGGDEEEDDEASNELTGHEDPEWHSYLLMSTRSSTIVLSTGNELKEETTQFFTAGRTYAAGNVLSLAVIQVYRHGVRLIDKALMVQENLWPPGLTTISAVVRDPYALVLLSDGTLRLVTTSERLGMPRFMVSQPDLEEMKDTPLPSVIYLYRDEGRTQWWKQTTNLPLPGPPAVELPSTTPRASRASAPTPTSSSAANTMSLTSFDPSSGGPNEIKVKPEPGLAFATGPVKPSAAPGWSKGKDASIEIIDVDELEEELLYGGTSSSSTGSGTSTVSGGVKTDTSLEHALWQRSMGVKLEGGLFPPMMPSGLPSLPSSSDTGANIGFPGSSADNALEIGEFEAEYMCIVSRGGWIEFYSVPSFRRVFVSPSLAAGRAVLENMPPELVAQRLQSAPSTPLANGSAASSVNDSYAPISDDALAVVELCVETLGPANSLPYLMAFLANGDLLIYQMYRYGADHPDLLPIRFSRVPHTFITRPPRSVGLAPLSRRTENTSRIRKWRGGSRFVKYDDVNGRHGLLVGGHRPAWIFAERGYVRLHSMIMEDDEDENQEDDDGAGEDEIQDGDVEPPITKKYRIGVSCSTPFHNINCDRGFIYIDMNGVLNVSQLPQPHPPVNYRFPLQASHHNPNHSDLQAVSDLDADVESEFVSYDCELAVRTVPLHCTAKFIVRHEPTQTYAVCVSRPVELISQEEATDRAPVVWGERYELLLYSPKTWEVIGRYDGFEEHEVVLSLATVKMMDKTYIVIGTSNLQGEEIAARGRVILLEVYFAMGITHLGGSKRFLKIKPFDQKEKGPVSAIAELDGHLLLCIGPRIILYLWDHVSLVGKAFYDCEFYCVSVQVLKNFVIFGDVYKSLYFVLWDPELKSLTLLGKDYEKLEVYTTSFLVDGPSLNLVVSDAQKNIQLFRYLPNRPESFMGKRLLPRADFHVGSHINKFMQLKTRQAGAGAGRALLRSMCLSGTLDGGICNISPIDDVVFRRLYSLHSQMTFQLPHLAALDPRGFRSFKSVTQSRQADRKNVVDGELVSLYMTLELEHQRRLARNIGTTPDQIIDNLRDIDRATRLG